MEEKVFLHQATNFIKQISELLENHPLNNEFDLDDHGKLLYINSKKGQYVINLHEPNKEIWLSSPLSGGHHFQFDSAKKQWYSKKKETDFESLLFNEIDLITK